MADRYCRQKGACPGIQFKLKQKCIKSFQGYNDDSMGYAIFGLEPGFYKWDQWIENGKYLISYDDSEFRSKERKTIEKALETLESKTHLKFVKYDRKTCTLGSHPCNWYIKYQRSKKGFMSPIGREKKSGPHFIQLLIKDERKENPMADITNYFYVIHEVWNLLLMGYQRGVFLQ